MCICNPTSQTPWCPTCRPSKTQHVQLPPVPPHPGCTFDPAGILCECSPKISPELAKARGCPYLTMANGSSITFVGDGTIQGTGLE
jgi:hypothetical protein